jgi:hypothetical protein
MKNLIFTLFAIGLAGFAAIAATSAMLNTPTRPAYIGPPKSDQPANPNAPTLPPTTPPAPPGTPPTVPPSSPPSSPPTSPPTTPPSTPAPSGDKPAGTEDEVDENPYGDIPPEELPPDLQYDADSSVSFPTNI